MKHTLVSIVCKFIPIVGRIYQKKIPTGFFFWAGVEALCIPSDNIIITIHGLNKQLFRMENHVLNKQLTNQQVMKCIRYSKIKMYSIMYMF